jgi:hypothetical protein
MGQNNFKELEKILVESRSKNSDKTKQNINSNINFFGFVSNIIDLYLPKLGNVLTSFDSSSDNIKNKK